MVTRFLHFAQKDKTQGKIETRVYVLPVCYIAAADHSLLQASIVLLQAINRRIAASLVPLRPCPQLAAASSIATSCDVATPARLMLSATTALRASAQPLDAAPLLTMKEGGGVVVSASRGIGAAIAKVWGQAVVVNYAASRTRFGCGSHRAGDDAIAMANMAELDDIKAMFKQVASEFGGCDVLVNNMASRDGLAMRQAPSGRMCWK